MSIEAMKQALDALDKRINGNFDGTPYSSIEYVAVLALREAIAEAEQHKVSQETDGLTVAYMSGFYDGKKKREWQGLTEEERDHFEGLHLYAARNQVEAWIEGVPSFIEAIEAKLREKNT